MSCYGNSSAGVGGGSNSSSKVVDGSCVDPEDFDSKTKYDSKTPFMWIQNPNNGTETSKYYYNSSHIYADFTLKPIKLTWKQYLDNIKKTYKDSDYKTVSISFGNTTDLGKIKDKYTYNPLNIIVGKVSKKYGAYNSYKKTNFAVFPNIVSGIAASCELCYNNYNKKNLCQINNQHQGYYTQDCSKERDDGYGWAALRLIWVTNQCRALGLEPGDALNLDNKTSLLYLVYATAITENKCILSLKDLSDGYDLYISKKNS